MDDAEPAVRGARRPHPNLLIYYVLQSLLLGPFFPVLLLPRFLKFRTLVYRFDDEGVTVRWGALFRREVSLTYARIQDIHLASNLIERWLGLARVQIQTAAGSATPEVTVEGLQDAEAIRDYLYTRMRGVRDSARPAAPRAPAAEPDAVAAALREAAGELRALRRELAAARGAGAEPEA